MDTPTSFRNLASEPVTVTDRFASPITVRPPAFIPPPRKSLWPTIAAVGVFTLMLGGGMVALKHAPTLAQWAGSMRSQVGAAVSSLTSSTDYYASSQTTASTSGASQGATNSQPQDFATIYSASTTPSAQPIQYVYTYPVIERVIETQKTLVQNGVSKEELAADLQELNNKLVAQIYGISAGASSPVASGGVVNTIAATNRIDQLSGVDISGGTISGAAISGGSISGVSISAGDVSGVLGITHGGTGTSTAPAYGQVLLGDGTGAYSLVATSSLGISGGSGADLSVANTWSALQLFSANASSSQLSVFQKSYFGGTATTTIDSAGNILGAGTLNVTGLTTLGYASTTQISSTASAYFATSGGNVGIGTTTPGSILTIAGGNITHTASGNPTLSGAYNTSSTTYDVAVSGKYAYLAEDTAGLQIIDVSNTASPTLTGTYNTSGFARGIAVSGKYAYVADYTAGLQIIDVSNSSSPSLVGTYNTSGNANGVTVSGKYAYVADDIAGLEIIDTSNPTSPSLVGTYNTSGVAHDVAISGQYAYVADETPGIQIIDISIPTSPILVGTYNTIGVAYDVVVSGKYAYVADGASGLEIIDVSNPASPSLVGTYDTSGLALGVTVSGTYAYVADGTTSGLQIINIASSTSPSLVGSYGTSFASAVAVSGKYAYVADSSGLKIIDINGLVTPAANIGSLETGTLNVTGDAIFGNDIFAQGGLNVGISGIFSRGGLGVFVASTTAANPIAATFMGGSVGIGTTSPFRKLSVTDTVTSAQFALAYDGVRSTQLLTDAAGDFTITPSGGDVFLTDANWWACTSGCAAGAPSGTGNVLAENKIGIGTTTPVSKLTIETQDGTTNFLQVASSTAQSLFVINANGNIGIASSTPFAKFSLGSGSIITTENSLSDGVTIAVDWLQGNQQKVTLGGNRTITFSNYTPGATLRLILCQDATGSRTVTWPATVLWGGGTAPTLTTTANKCDVITMITTSATGTVEQLGTSVLSF